MRKITVVGAGKVGSTITQLIAYKGLGDVVLVNRTVGKAKGIALDLSESAPAEGFDASIEGTDDYSSTKGSDVVIITAGLQRKRGMSRDELMGGNAVIVREAAKNLARYSPDAVMIVVTNPLDVMVSVALKASGFRKRKVVGMAGMLDTSRYRSFIAKELGVSVKDVSGMVLGGHGDFMLPLPHHTNVNGIPLKQLLPSGKISRIIKRTVQAGAEIISLENSSAYYAPGSSVVQMVESILLDRKRVLPCSAYLNGEYGIKGIFLGVPVILGSGGVERIIELSLSSKEKKHLQSSGKKIRANIRKL